jgi:hypothetical protein
MITIAPYDKCGGRTRAWAIYLDGQLLAVTLYRKGAMAVADILKKHGYQFGYHLPA